MERPLRQHSANGYTRLRADVPQRVIIAFDQLTTDEKNKVLAALHTLESGGLQAMAGTASLKRLAGLEPLYALRVAPEVWVIVRAEPKASVDVVDIVRPAALRNVAHGGC